MNNQPMYNPFAQNVAIVKNYFKRPAVLVLAILYIASIVMSLIIGLTTGTTMSDMYSAMFAIPEIAQDMTTTDVQMLNTFTSSGFLSTFVLIAMVPSLVLLIFQTVAYFIIYFKSKNEDPNVTPKGGFTILYILAILNLVSAIFASLIFLLYVILCVVAIIVFAQDPTMTGTDVTMFTIVFSILALVMAGVGTIMLTYAISNYNYIKSARNSLTSAVLSNKGAGVYGIMSIIFGIFSGLSIIPSLLSAPVIEFFAQTMSSELPTGFVELFSLMSSVYLVTSIASAISVAAMIVDAVIARGYKKYIDEVTGGYSNNPYPTYSEQLSSIPPMPPVCPQCGTPYNNGDVFCGVCGNQINQQ